MLSADALAALEASLPPVHPPLHPSDDEMSRSSSEADPLASPRSSWAAGLPGSCSSSAGDSSASGSVGAIRSERAVGTDASYDSVEKWILAALREAGGTKEDLVDASCEPNDALASQLHATISRWRVAGTLARDAGVQDHRPAELNKGPPQCVLAKTRGWLIRHVNRERAARGIREVDEKWARTLAGVKADAREVNADVRDGKARTGALYHHKHDLAPTYEQLTTMCATAFTGDGRVDASVLDACEAGMSLAIYYFTGARGSELKTMHLQSIGYEEVVHEKSGHLFRCLKLTAFECKSKDEHLNQLLASSNAWRCGVGGLGVALLLRVVMFGPPPFAMQRDASSWKVVSTSVGKSFDRRLNNAFEVAGVRRQSGDPLTYLGRHFGSRVLQHQGGSSEGGAARRGHSCGRTFAYSECPLPDLLRLMGNDPTDPFMPAHLQPSLFAPADAVLLVLFPQLAQWRAELERRHDEVDRMRGKSVRMRTDEQLNDKERMLNGIEYACRVAVLCLAARPRTWKRWSIAEEAPTMWQQCATNRVVQSLFAQNSAAIRAMNELAVQVRRCEESELVARKASPAGGVSDAVVAAVQSLRDGQAKREQELIAQQRAMFELLMRRVTTPVPSEASPGDAPPPPPAPLEVAAVLAAPPGAAAAASPAVVAAPLPGAREKRKPQDQHDVAHFSSHPTLRAAFEYAREELYPMERDRGPSWRVRKLEDGREDKSRDRQWRFYRQLAVAVGVQDAPLDEALEVLERRRLAAASLTAFNGALHAEQVGVANAHRIAMRAFAGAAERQ